MDETSYLYYNNLGLVEKNKNKLLDLGLPEERIDRLVLHNGYIASDLPHHRSSAPDFYAGDLIVNYLEQAPVEVREQALEGLIAITEVSCQDGPRSHVMNDIMNNTICLNEIGIAIEEVYKKPPLNTRYRDLRKMAQQGRSLGV